MGAAVVLAGCSFFEEDEQPVELSVTEIDLPGEYDHDGHHTWDWQMLPGTEELPALAMAIGQESGVDPEPVLHLWHAERHEYFEDFQALSEAGSDILAFALGGDGERAVVGGHRRSGQAEEGFLLTSSDRSSWEPIDLGEHEDLAISAAGGSADLVVATATSPDDAAQILLVDDGAPVLTALPPADGVEQTVVTHVLVDGDEVVLSGHEQTRGQPDEAAIWLSTDRGREFTRTNLQAEGSVAGAVRLGSRYFATGQERDGQWLRGQVWTSGNGMSWWPYTDDPYRNLDHWTGSEGDHAFGVPHSDGERWSAPLWQEGSRVLGVAYFEQEGQWFGTGAPAQSEAPGISGVVVPEGAGHYRVLASSPDELRQYRWTEDGTADSDLTSVTLGSTVRSLTRTPEGTLVSTTRRAITPLDEEYTLFHPEMATYALDEDVGQLPPGLEDLGVAASTEAGGAHALVGAGGADVRQMPVWFRSGADADWEEVTITPPGQHDAVEAGWVGERAGIWVVLGRSGELAGPDGLTATVWTSPDGRDWDDGYVLTGPDGQRAQVSVACASNDGLLVAGGYERLDGGWAPALWHSNGEQGDGEQWELLEVDESHRASLTGCRTQDGMLEVRAGLDHWTTPDLDEFTYEREEEEWGTWRSSSEPFGEARAGVGASDGETVLWYSLTGEHWEVVDVPLPAELSEVVLTREDGALIVAERRSGRAWRIEHVADLLEQEARFAAEEDG